MSLFRFNLTSADADSSDISSRPFLAHESTTLDEVYTPLYSKFSCAEEQMSFTSDYCSGSYDSINGCDDSLVGDRSTNNVFHACTSSVFSPSSTAQKSCDNIAISSSSADAYQTSESLLFNGATESFQDVGLFDIDRDVSSASLADRDFSLGSSREQNEDSLLYTPDEALDTVDEMNCTESLADIRTDEFSLMLDEFLQLYLQLISALDVIETKLYGSCFKCIDSDLHRDLQDQLTSHSDTLHSFEQLYIQLSSAHSLPDTDSARARFPVSWFHKRLSRAWANLSERLSARSSQPESSVLLKDSKFTSSDCFSSDLPDYSMSYEYVNYSYHIDPSTAKLPCHPDACLISSYSCTKLCSHTNNYKLLAQLHSNSCHMIDIDNIGAYQQSTNNISTSRFFHSTSCCPSVNTPLAYNSPCVYSAQTPVTVSCVPSSAHIHPQQSQCHALYRTAELSRLVADCEQLAHRPLLLPPTTASLSSHLSQYQLLSSCDASDEDSSVDLECKDIGEFQPRICLSKAKSSLALSVTRRRIRLRRGTRPWSIHAIGGSYDTTGMFGRPMPSSYLNCISDNCITSGSSSTTLTPHSSQTIVPSDISSSHSLVNHTRRCSTDTEESRNQLSCDQMTHDLSHTNSQTPFQFDSVKLEFSDDTSDPVWDSYQEIKPIREGDSECSEVIEEDKLERLFDCDDYRLHIDSDGSVRCSSEASGLPKCFSRQQHTRRVRCLKRRETRDIREIDERAAVDGDESDVCAEMERLELFHKRLTRLGSELNSSTCSHAMELLSSFDDELEHLKSKFQNNRKRRSQEYFQKIQAIDEEFQTLHNKIGEICSQKVRITECVLRMDRLLDDVKSSLRSLHLKQIQDVDVRMHEIKNLADNLTLAYNSVDNSFTNTAVSFEMDCLRQKYDYVNSRLCSQLSELERLKSMWTLFFQRGGDLVRTLQCDNEKLLHTTVSKKNCVYQCDSDLEDLCEETSGYESTSSDEERVRSYREISRIARDLGNHFSHDSCAWTQIHSTLVTARSELKNFCSTKRSVRAAVNSFHPDRVLCNLRSVQCQQILNNSSPISPARNRKRYGTLLCGHRVPASAVWVAGAFYLLTVTMLFVGYTLQPSCCSSLSAYHSIWPRLHDYDAPPPI